MSNIKNAVRRSNIAVLLFVLLALAFLFIITGCTTTEAVAADPKASAATVEEDTVTAEVEPPAIDELVKQFGDVVTYKDGVSISVSAPTPFTPSNLDYFPLAEGETAVILKVVLTNNSDKPFEPSALAQANSGGKPATYLSDYANPEYGNVGGFPTTSILPGQTLEWFVGFGVADPADITLEISPTPFEYDNAIFTNVAF